MGMGKSKRGKNRRNLLGSHQRSWVWGRRTVLEILQAGSWPMAEIRLDETLPPPEIDTARGLAEALGVAFHLEPAKRLLELCHAPDHQGYLAKMFEFPYTDLEEILAPLSPQAPESADETPSSPAPAPPRAPLFVLLDAIQDPFNFGAIVRSAEVLGVDAIFIGEQGQSPVNSQVARSSAGAVNRVPIVRVPDLIALASRLRDLGLALVAADEKAQIDCADFDFRPPTALLLGNEGSGVRPELQALSHARVKIPQHGHIGSLNVAVAAGILLYEARRQRK